MNCQMTLKEKYKTLTKSNMKTQIESRFFAQIYTTHNIVNKNGRQCYQLQAKQIIDDRPQMIAKKPRLFRGTYTEHSYMIKENNSDYLYKYIWISTFGPVDLKLPMLKL